MQQHDTQNLDPKETTHDPKETTRTSTTTQVITIYCLCDDFLRARRWHDEPQAQMSTAEVVTVSLVAAALFDGNQEKSRRFLKEHGYILAMLSKSRFTPIKPQPPLSRPPGSALAGTAVAAGGSGQACHPRGHLRRR